MDFAKKQLEKYGWKEGEGLGKNKVGISNPIKARLKFDKGGLGLDLFEDIDQAWWQKVYDEAAKNITVNKDLNDCLIFQTVDDSFEISCKRKKSKRCNNSTETIYKNFIKTSELYRNTEKKIIKGEEKERCVQRNTVVTSGICDLTDEELLKICGGRTAHKGARHGLKMNAKLARLKEQENTLCATESNEHAGESANKIKNNNKSKSKSKNKKIKKK